MFCPNCGAKTSTEQKFCRACGLGLEKIALSLTEQRPNRPDENLMSQKERLEKIALALLGVFGVGLLGVMLYGIVYKLMITEGRFWSALAMLGFLIMCGCGVGAALLFAKAKEVEEAAGKRRLPHVEPAPTRELLSEGNFEPVPSVTDRTTELLFAEKRKTNETTR